VSPPWITTSEITLNPTPQPNEAANAIEAKASSADFSSSWSAPLPSPSFDRAQDGQRPDAEDQRAGDEALDEPSPALDAGPAPEAAYGEPLEHPTEGLEPVLDPQQRADDAAEQDAAQHDQHRGAGADGVGEVTVVDVHGRGGRDQQGDQPEPVGHHLAGPLG
jgi:hypothetical protein